MLLWIQILVDTSKYIVNIITRYEVSLNLEFIMGIDIKKTR